MKIRLLMIAIMLCTSIQAQIPQSSNLVGEYKFSGRTDDSSGNSYDGQTNINKKNKENISRKQALEKMGKYAALTALGTFMILNPKKAQAQSPPDPGDNPFGI